MNGEDIKVRFELDDGGVEVMHARALSNDVFVLDNIPFYAYGVSCGDVVTVRCIDDGLVFVAVAERGGHSTYRVKMAASAMHDTFLARWAELERLGCSYEGSNVNNRLLYALDVPPGAPLNKIYKILEQGEADGVWDFEEGDYCPSGK
ncbi:DUF4265 domain-containing protein [Stenotrophomonas cyclobalanopsidis]|uniref:DUF4265 domain-containing protein n=1 Tax=Stenotrophomonas cyclobalanopsidis TaxID=2771362 RepID=A0ABQ6SYX9_9GAMM|nr:DUF4265 domain-containing protein [Stenotrophomonas cyclobalanopsidis]KAA8996315.1 DUF4265 domain-containing protein [Stenotrophomonas cyclobalanopsidis]